MYTAAPGSGAPPPASTSVSLIVVGTPSATVVLEPKLERMSLRTMPVSDSTSTPLDPSPGKGPAVSSGITCSAAAEVLGAAVALGADVVACAAALDVADDLLSDPQPAISAASPAPANIV